MASVKLLVPNAILFVVDPLNTEAEVPACSTSEVVSATDTCLSICTMAEVDGETEVTLLSAEEPAPSLGTLSLASTVTLGCPSHQVAVVTSEFKVLGERTLQRESAVCEVWVDRGTSPSQVVVVIK